MKIRINREFNSTITPLKTRIAVIILPGHPENKEPEVSPFAVFLVQIFQPGTSWIKNHPVFITLQTTNSKITGQSVVQNIFQLPK